MHRVGWWLWAAALLVWFVTGSPVLSQGSGALSEADYWALVAQTQAVVATDAPLAALATEWEAVQSIQLDDGRSMPVDTGFIVALLSAESPDRDRIAALMATLAAAPETWTMPPASAAAADELSRVLARSEFDYSPEPPSLWAQIRQQILEALFGSQATDAIAGFFARLWPVAAVIVLVAVAVYIVRSFSTQFAAQSEISAEDPHVPNLTTVTARKRADERVAAGDYRDAVRYLYLATLLHLDESDILTYDRTRTNREYVRRVRDNRVIADHLQAVVDVFDAVWYGFHPISPTQYDEYTAHVNALQSADKRPVKTGVVA